MTTLRPSLDDRIHRPYKVGVLLESLAAAGVPAAEGLAGSGIDAAALGDASTLVSLRQLLAVYANVQRLSPDPGLALRSGMRIHITQFGMYGYALLASTSAHQAIDFAIKYRALASPLLGLRFGLDGGEVVWSFEDVLGLGVDSSLFHFVFEFQLGTQLALHRDLLGATLTPTRVRASSASLPHADLYGELLGCGVEFDTGVNELRFDSAWLEQPLAFANPITASVVQQTCDRLLAEMHHASGLAGRVASLLLQAPGRFLDIDSVSERLHLNSRTLRRRLQLEGTSYQQVLDSVRRQLALDYLRDTGMSTEDIAASLGFSDAANFRHAFKRWTGRSTGSYRTGAGAGLAVSQDQTKL